MMNNIPYFTFLILILYQSSIVISIKANSSPLTTHILDTARGKPAASVHITLYRLDKLNQFVKLNEAITNGDGRVSGCLIKPEDFTKGTYKLFFDTKGYFDTQNIPAFYPYVEIVFSISEPSEHYHIPLLLSPYGYSTYKGS